MSANLVIGYLFIYYIAIAEMGYRRESCGTHDIKQLKLKTLCILILDAIGIDLISECGEHFSTSSFIRYTQKSAGVI